MNKKIPAIFFITAAFLAAVIIYPNAPGNSRFYPPCIFKKITGYDCAGCGSARACYHIMHGNIIQAAGHNILLLIFIPVLVIGFIHLFTGKLKKVWQMLNKPLLILWLIVFFWLLRNIPFFPFEWLHSDK
jgi:hypothetical protein